MEEFNLTKYLEDFKKLEEFKEKKKEKEESDNLEELYDALAKAQQEMEAAKTDSSNPFLKSKYASFAQLIETSRKVLTKNGLAIIQRIRTKGNSKIYLYTRLCHSSGQWIESKMEIPSTNGEAKKGLTVIQELGSSLTYLKRYSYASIIGLAWSDDNDDDGEGTRTKKNFHEKITEEQYVDIWGLMNELPEGLQKYVLKWLQITDLKDMPQGKFDSCKMWVLKKIEDLRKEKEKDLL